MEKIDYGQYEKKKSKTFLVIFIRQSKHLKTSIGRYLPVQDLV